MKIALQLVPDSANDHRAGVTNLKQRHIARSAKADDQLAQKGAAGGFAAAEGAVLQKTAGIPSYANPIFIFCLLIKEIIKIFLL